MDVIIGPVKIKVSSAAKSDVACNLDVPENKQPGAAAQSSYSADYKLQNFESGPGRTPAETDRVVEGLQNGAIQSGPRPGENMWASNRQEVCNLATAEFNADLRKKGVNHTALDCEVKVKQYAIGLTADKKNIEIQDPQVSVTCKEKR